MKMKEIAALSPDRVKVILFGLHYAKAWNGTLGHWWVTSRLTLCGKELVSHGEERWYHSAARGSCAACKKRRQALEKRGHETL